MSHNHRVGQELSLTKYSLLYLLLYMEHWLSHETPTTFLVGKHLLTHLHFPLSLLPSWLVISSLPWVTSLPIAPHLSLSLTLLDSRQQHSLTLDNGASPLITLRWISVTNHSFMSVTSFAVLIVMYIFCHENTLKIPWSDSKHTTFIHATSKRLLFRPPRPLLLLLPATLPSHLQSAHQPNRYRGGSQPLY